MPRNYSSIALDWLRASETHYDLKNLRKQQTSDREAGPSHQPDTAQPIEQVDGQSQQPLLTQLLNTMNEIQVPTFNVENDLHEMPLIESIEPTDYTMQVDETLADVSRPKRPLPQLLPICEPPKKIAKRRASVAGGIMFSVDNQVTERSSDYLERFTPKWLNHLFKVEF